MLSSLPCLSSRSASITNTSRKYGGGQKEIKLGTHADDASIYGAHQGGKRATSATARLAIRTAFEKLGSVAIEVQKSEPFCDGE